jgi:hypothetical protein
VFPVDAQQPCTQTLTEPAQVRDTIRRLAGINSRVELTVNLRSGSIPLVFGANFDSPSQGTTGPGSHPVIREFRQRTFTGEVTWAGDSEFKFQRRGGELELRLYYEDVESICGQLAAVFSSKSEAIAAMQGPHGHGQVPTMRYAVQTMGGDFPFVEVTLSESAASSVSAQLAHLAGSPGKGRKTQAVRFDPARRAVVGRVTATYENEFELDVGPSRVRIAYQDVSGVGRYEPVTWASKTDRVFQGIVSVPFRVACVVLGGDFHRCLFE